MDFGHFGGTYFLENLPARRRWCSVAGTSPVRRRSVGGQSPVGHRSPAERVYKDPTGENQGKPPKLNESLQIFLRLC